MNEAQRKNYVLFYIPLRHPFFVKTSVVFTREKLRTFLHSPYVIRFCKNFSGFYKGKTYGLFYCKNFFVKTSVVFTREKLRTFLHSPYVIRFCKNFSGFYKGKTYGLFYCKNFRLFYSKNQ